MKNNKNLRLSKYEKILFCVVENVVQKLTAAVILYEGKCAYTSAYFLAIIAQEELAKLILLPIAKELGELNELISKKNSAFYNHRVKQKLIRTYSFFERDWQNLEEKKQNCLYVGYDDNCKPRYCRITPKECYKEIKSAIWFYQYQMKCINTEKTFSRDFIKTLLFMTKILGGCVNEKIPNLHKEMMLEVKNATKHMRINKIKAREALFKNPYELVRITKYALGPSYKKFLRRIQKMEFKDMVEYLGTKL